MFIFVDCFIVLIRLISDKVLCFMSDSHSKRDYVIKQTKMKKPIDNELRFGFPLNPIKVISKITFPLLQTSMNATLTLDAREKFAAVSELV